MVTPDGSGLRVLLADDHAWVRGQIRTMLEADGCEICGEAATAEEAIALAVETEPDVALLDIHMPGSGIHAARVIGDRLPQTAVVMLTHSRQDEDLFDALRAGASGYLLKESDPHGITQSLRGVLAGEAAMPPQLVTRVLDEFRTPRRLIQRRSGAADKLSPREREVMGLLSQGLSTEDAAAKLFVSATTVRVHVSSVLRKLRVKDRQSALNLLKDR